MLTTHFSQVKDFQGTSLRSVLREKALDFLSWKLNDGKVKEAFSKPRIQFLYIHHIFQDEEMGLRGLLQLLTADHTFISHSEAVERILSGRIDKPYISISSDDGFENNLVAAKILAEFNAPACFFVNPDTIGLTASDDIASFCEERLSFPPTSFLSWQQVDSLQTQGHEIGSHTMGHVNITDLSLSQVKENLAESKMQLEKHCGSCDHFAYPYGRYFHFNKAAMSACFEEGYLSCSSAERGCHFPTESLLPKEDLLLRRDHVISHWNPKHVLYFMYKNVMNSDMNTNLNPFD